MNKNIIKELEQETFIPVYHQDHSEQPYFIRCVKCGNKLLEWKSKTQAEEVYQVLQQHKSKNHGDN